MTTRAGSGRLRRGLKVSGQYVAPSPSAPSNVVAPVISGNPYVGQVLTCSQGQWAGYPAPTLSYQWKSGATNVGTNSNTYTPVSGDIGNAITCTVTATNASGSASATSAATAAISAQPVAPAFTANPSIDNTSPSVGQTLTGSDGTITGSPTPTVTSHIWKANGVQVGTGATYVVQAADEGKTITFTVTASNSEGSASETSAATSAVTSAPLTSSVLLADGSSHLLRTDSSRVLLAAGVAGFTLLGSSTFILLDGSPFSLLG